LKTPYPPSPWKLRADLDLSLFWLPIQTVRKTIPPEYDAVSFFHRALVGAAWVDYGPQGPACVLAYRELLIAVLVWQGGKPKVHITRIWVDLAPSVAGGQNLWGIPKDLGVIQRQEEAQGRVTWSLSGRDGFLAHAQFQQGKSYFRLPFWAQMKLIQNSRQGAPVVTPFTMRGWLKWARAPRWQFGEAAGLAGLFGQARPLLNVQLRSVAIQFGS
jgi:hypothetical protein